MKISLFGTEITPLKKIMKLFSLVLLFYILTLQIYNVLEHSQRSCKCSIFVKIDDTVAKKHKKTLAADPLL